MVVPTYAAAPQRPATRLSWAVPLIPAAVSGFCLSALLYYHVQYGGDQPGQGWIQSMVVGLYRLLGFVPAVMLALLAFVWSTIWYVSGQVDRPGRRGLRVLAFTIALSILVGLQPGTTEELRSGGIVGSFLALRLESVVGYVAGTLMAASAVIFALLLATDMMFYRYFEPLGRASGDRRRSEDGVEAEAVQDMKALRLEGGFATGMAVAEADDADEEAYFQDDKEGKGDAYRSSWRDRVAVAAAADAEDLLDEGDDDPVGEGSDLEYEEAGDEDEDEEFEADEEEAEDDEEPQLSAEEDDEEEEGDEDVELQYRGTDDDDDVAEEDDDDDLEDDDLEDDDLEDEEYEADEDDEVDDEDAELEYDEDDEAEEGDEVDNEAELLAPKAGGGAGTRTEPVKVQVGSDDEDLDLGIDEEALARLDGGLADPVVPIRASAAADNGSRQGKLFDAAVPDADLIAEAAALVRAAGRASVTLLQRRLRVGYQEAQDLMDTLRRQGIVGGEEGEPQGAFLRSGS